MVDPEGEVKNLLMVRCPKQISGCSPIAAETLEFDDALARAIEQSGGEGEERLRKARSELVEEEGGKRSELTVIGELDRYSIIS